MGRPKKVQPPEQKQIITLEELDRLYRKHTNDTTQLSVPIERIQSFYALAKNNPMLWQRNYLMRQKQLHELGLIETHETDYYSQNKQPIFI
jgi:hypothetical protein